MLRVARPWRQSFMSACSASSTGSGSASGSSHRSHCLSRYSAYGSTFSSTCSGRVLGTGSSDARPSCGPCGLRDASASTSRSARWTVRVATLGDQVGVVGGHHDRQSVLSFRLQPGRQPRDALDVQPLLRLVEDEEFPGTDERRRQRETPTLTRRERAGELSGLRHQLHLPEDLVDSVLGVGDAVRSGQQVEVFHHRQVREEVQVVVTVATALRMAGSSRSSDASTRSDRMWACRHPRCSAESWFAEQFLPVRQSHLPDTSGEVLHDRHGARNG